MFLVVTPNPAVDRTLTVPAFGPYIVSRATEVIIAAGGKGLNVARAFKILGRSVCCAGFLGGHGGRLVAELAEKEGLPGAWTWIEAETRTCLIVISPEGDDDTVVNEPGPVLSVTDWDHLTADILREAAAAQCVCLSGSLPLGLDPAGYGDLIRQLRRAGHPVWVDTSKAPLQAALNAGPSGIKVNVRELGEALGRRLDNQAAAITAAQEVCQLGAETVVLTLGPEGGILVNEAGYWRATPPPVEAVSAVASGDSFLAGLVAALFDGASPPEALRQGVAAGTANTLQAGGAAFTREKFELVLAGTTVAAVNAAL